MYLLAKEKFITDETESEIYGITDNDKLLITFTEDIEEAKEFVRICNENNVELNHISDLIEDFYYS